MNSLLVGKSKYIVIGILIILIISLVLLIINLQNQQNLRQEAAEDDMSILASVAGSPVTRDDVLTYADTMYKTTPSDNESLQVMLNELTEKRVVETIAQREGFTATNEEIERQLEQDGFTDFASDPLVRENAKESVLKRKIERRFTRSRDAFTVGFWIPPENYGVPIPPEQVELVEEQRTISDEAISFIEERMQNGEDPFEIALALQEEFPPLASITAVNGYIVENEENAKLMTEPILYSYQAGRSSLPLFQSLFSLSVGEVAVVADEETNDGGIVVKVVGATEGQYDNYSEWYRAVRSQEVTLMNDL